MQIAVDAWIYGSGQSHSMYQFCRTKAFVRENTLNIYAMCFSISQFVLILTSLFQPIATHSSTNQIRDRVFKKYTICPIFTWSIFVTGTHAILRLIRRRILADLRKSPIFSHMGKLIGTFQYFVRESLAYAAIKAGTEGRACSCRRSG